MITSRQNNMFKNWMKLKQSKYRNKEQAFLVYGPHLVEEALKAGVVLEIITSNEYTEGTLISRDLMEELNVTETAYDIAAICKMDNKIIPSSKILVLEDVQDPDNVGALIRSAAAFGFEHVILSDKCANIYNEKVIRASQGSIFHVSHEITSDIYKAVENLIVNDYIIYATDLRSSTNEIQGGNIALVLGNEGNGISEQMRTLSHELISIPTENVESLNVSIAGSILMYEWSKIWD